jgi:hypothetical protein
VTEFLLVATGVMMAQDAFQTAVAKTPAAKFACVLIEMLF